MLDTIIFLLLPFLVVLSIIIILCCYLRFRKKKRNERVTSFGLQQNQVQVAASYNVQQGQVHFQRPNTQAVFAIAGVMTTSNGQQTNSSQFTDRSLHYSVTDHQFPVPTQRPATSKTEFQGSHDDLPPSYFSIFPNQSEMQPH